MWTFRLVCGSEDHSNLDSSRAIYLAVYFSLNLVALSLEKGGTFFFLREKKNDGIQIKICRTASVFTFVVHCRSRRHRSIVEEGKKRTP